jgi:nicotinamidase-related amidase
MSYQSTLEALKQAYLPVEQNTVELGAHAGLVIVDIVKGFAEVGHGPLAPPTENAQVTRMIDETNRLAKDFIHRERPILAFLDTHVPEKEEPPYPPHCEIGTGHENFVDALAWLDKEPSVKQIRKDCINGYIGAEAANGQNAFVHWIREHQIEQLIVVGICTDICVMDFVLTTLSARNHGMLGSVRDVIVYEPACATYDLSAETITQLDLPITATHPQEITHHVGLYLMASRGAIIAKHLIN